MDNNEKREIALFRFSLIAPLVNETYNTTFKSEFYRMIASKEHTLPSGAAAKFSSGTIKKWYLEYKNKGFDSLIPKSRADAGRPRNIDANAIKKIHELKESLPYITGTLISVFKKTILKYGVPKRLFVDNGGTYKNDQLRLTCASLGIILIHSKAYSPESKSKIERVFRTIKDNWMNGINWNEYSSLESLNIDFNKYLNEKYSNSIHSSLTTTPRERFIQDISKIKLLPQGELDAHFLHRVSRRVNNDATISLSSLQFEVPAKYIRQKINIRYSPINLDKAFIFDKDDKLSETIYPLKKVDNSKIKRNVIDYSKITGGDLNV